MDTDRFLTGKVALVTGGTRGIGRAIASALLGQGAAVALCGRTEEGVQLAVESLREETGGQVEGRAADVSCWDDVEALYDFLDRTFGVLDILVNNAGIGVFRSVEELTPQEWRRVLGVNLTGAFYCSRLALPRFRARGGGFVVNIGSLAGKNPFAGGAAYNASKFGLNGFSEAMMLDHRYDRVRVSTILPGSVATEFGSGGGEDWKIAPEDVAEIVLAVLRMPERTLVSRVEVRPSRPQK
ncbi:MAG: SDR family oxidoreductase [Acidobacteria bacterium]|nr:SDR family oxidoreductase [Acidobacteriota bacterium]